MKEIKKNQKFKINIEKIIPKRPNRELRVKTN
jgi:hypothetical protein